MDKFKVKCKSRENKTYGIYNTDMKSFQYIDEWRGTETINLQDAVLIALSLNKKHINNSQS